MPYSRRDFIRHAGMAGVISIAPSFNSTAHPQSTNSHLVSPADVLPSQAQKKWMDLKFGMFVHFGINTFYDVEWSDGTLDPSKFNPSDLDTDQWCRVAQEAGMKYIVIITKHHDGFCNWSTKTTKYSVKSTPFNRDLIAEVVKSARKYGLEVGLYYSLWDRHEKSHDQDERKYVDFMKVQLTELLTKYGPIVELWFDGFWKKQKSGWSKKDEILGELVEVSGVVTRDAEFIKAWRMEGAYRWQMDHLYQHIKTLQPNCLVMNNTTTAYPGVPLHPVDIRSGEKYTKPKPDTKVWNWLGQDIYLPLQIETTMSVKGSKEFPSGNWFWHKEDHSVASKEQILSWLSISENMQANLLLNVGPMDNGKLRPEDVKVLSSLKR